MKKLLFVLIAVALSCTVIASPNPLKTVESTNENVFAEPSDTVHGELQDADTYTISYDANGGEGAPAEQTKIKGKNIDLSPIEPVKQGYNFLGWATTKNGKVEYKPKSKYIQDANITLYAVWHIRFNVTFDANGGENAPDSQINETSDHIIVSSVIPAKEGYIFTGWATTPAGKVKHIPEEKFSSEEDVTFYAVWRTFDCAGGVGTKESPCIISTGAHLLGIAPLVNDSKGMKFYFNLEDDIDFEGAEWTPIGTASNPFNGAFYGNGHSVSNFKITAGRADNGFFGYVKHADITNLSLHNVTLKYNYTGSTAAYAGILSGRLCKEQTDTDVVNTISGISVTGNIEISPKSSASYTGGLIGNINAESGNYTVENCLSLTDISIAYEGTRMVYVGGITAKLDDGVSTTLKIKNSYYNGDINITSQGEVTCGGIVGGVFSGGNGWVPGWYGTLMDSDTELNISKNAAGGSITVNTTGNINVGYVSGYMNDNTQQDKCARLSTMKISAKKNGTDYTKIADLPKSVKPKDFKSYATGTLGFDEKVWVFDYAEDIPLLKNTVLEKISYNANGGENAPEEQLKIYNSDIILLSTVPTRTGHTFLGWSTTKDGEVEYAPGSTYTLNESKTLYAVWEMVECFFNNGTKANQADISLLAELLSGKADESSSTWIEKANTHTEESDTETEPVLNINIKDLIKLAQLAFNK